MPIFHTQNKLLISLWKLMSFSEAFSSFFLSTQHRLYIFFFLPGSRGSLGPASQPFGDPIPILTPNFMGQMANILDPDYFLDPKCDTHNKSNNSVKLKWDSSQIFWFWSLLLLLSQPRPRFFSACPLLLLPFLFSPPVSFTWPFFLARNIARKVDCGILW